MTDQHARMIGRAKMVHPEARPIGNSGRGWESCFTVYDGKRILWYDDDTGSSHVIVEPMEKHCPECGAVWENNRCTAQCQTRGLI